jgi:hypothetical protein
LGGNWDYEQVSSVAAAADYYGWPDLAAGQVSEWDRKKDYIISGEAH